MRKTAGIELMDESIWKMTAVEAHESLKKREISASEILEASINRIRSVDKILNALPEKCFKRARRVADEIDNLPQKSGNNLLGLPIAVKDYNDLSGVRTTFGSPIFKDNIPHYSDRTVKILEDNGANPVAKSNVPEWAGGHTINPVFGITRNPWNISKTAGGSSGGSASALASGQVFLGTGNDLGGSLRTPAGFNGIVGLRPSPGLVARGKRYLPFDTLWVEGPMARNVQDVSLMLDAMVLHDKSDPLSIPAPEVSFLEYLKEDYLPKSISVSEDLGILPVENDVRGVFKTAVKKISKLGWHIEYDIPNFTGVLNAFKTLRGILIASMLDEIAKKNKGNILDDILKNIKVGYDVTGFQIIEAEKTRHKLSLEMEKFFTKHEFLLCPTASVSPFSVEKKYIDVIEGTKCETYIDWFAITFAITMTSCPTLSIPCGFTDSGMPVGIQIVGSPRNEHKLLNFGKRLQEIFDVAKLLPITPKSF